ncbi:hypothetical protein [Rhizobacter sp. Root1221]|uniref:hypothetical protein n=1 Tax=Rhizobacter sp. Root1221 TaxID=1736433 RepID=UPI0006FF0D75|nr:hypothetical protein [Rhizobacter sp. Root1221]KQW02222.1 hypothetical protein ASC87_13405 [Rhizobacter sp. Root1221]
MEILKRIARWVLREERATVEQAFVALQQAFTRQHAAATSYSNELGRIRARVGKATDWANEHRPNSTDLRAVTQFIVEGAEGLHANCRGVHPFDRWGVFPKP